MSSGAKMLCLPAPSMEPWLSASLRGAAATHPLPVAACWDAAELGAACTEPAPSELTGVLATALLCGRLAGGGPSAGLPGSRCTGGAWVTCSGGGAGGLCRSQASRLPSFRAWANFNSTADSWCRASGPKVAEEPCSIGRIGRFCQGCHILTHAAGVRDQTSSLGSLRCRLAACKACRCLHMVQTAARMPYKQYCD